MSWTTDHAVAGIDGCYDINIRANHQYRAQIAEIVVGGLAVGGRLVPVEPGGLTKNANIEVGRGFVVRGVVRDVGGRPVAGVHVMDVRTYVDSETDARGQFALPVAAAGRLQLHVFAPRGGGLPREYAQTAPVVFDVDRLDGEVSGVVVTIDQLTARSGGSDERTIPDGTTVEIAPVSLRPGAGTPDGWCTAWARRADVLEPIVTSHTPRLQITSRPFV